MRGGFLLLTVAAVMIAQQTPASRYTDLVGYSVNIPSGWTLHSRKPSKAPGSCIDLTDPESGIAANICGKPHDTAARKIDHRLQSSIDEHIAGNSGATLRSGSVTSFQIGSRQAISAIFDYPNAAVEQITWVQSEATRLIFAIRLPEGGNIEKAQQRFKPILNSLTMP